MAMTPGGESGRRELIRINSHRAAVHGIVFSLSSSNAFLNYSFRVCLSLLRQQRQLLPWPCWRVLPQAQASNHKFSFLVAKRGGCGVAVGEGEGAFPARPVAAGGWEASHEQTPQGAGPVQQGHPSPSPAHIQHSHKVFCWVAEGEKRKKKENGSNHNKLRLTALNCEEWIPLERRVGSCWLSVYKVAV